MFLLLVRSHGTFRNRGTADVVELSEHQAGSLTKVFVTPITFRKCDAWFRYDELSER